MAPVVSVSGLGFRFAAPDPWLFRGLSFTVGAGEICTIVGRSGRGKSTLLRLLGGLRAPTEGTIRYGHQAARVAGFMFQDARLLPWRSAVANVALGCETLPLSGVERAARVAEALDTVGLRALSRRYPHQLSGGQQQRLALARALVCGAPLLLLDEPFSSLDRTTHREMIAVVREIAHSARRAVVVVSHHVEDVEEFGRDGANRIIDLDALEQSLPLARAAL